MQDKIATEGIKKDYVQMAITVLNEKKDGQDDELRRWAVNIVDANSPIRLPSSFKNKLREGTVDLPGIVTAPYQPPSSRYPRYKGSVPEH